MAVRKGTKAAAAKAAPKPKTRAAKKPVVEEDESVRVVAAATIDMKSAEFGDISERYQNWVRRWQENGVAFAMKNVHRILGHKKGLFIISTTGGMFQVGQMSASGKSFNVEFESEDSAEAWEYYREERVPVGAGKPEKAAAPKKGKAAPAAKRTATKKAAPKPRRRAKAAASDDEDLDDLLD